MRILVTGGCGYIGSVVVEKLLEAEHEVVTTDSMERGQYMNPKVTAHYAIKVGDPKMENVLRTHRTQVVMHFAAFAYVSESIEQPLEYYENNVCQTVGLLASMKRAGVRRFVFSSTCSTFGIPTELPITEDTPQVPINIYGETKLTIERLLRQMVESEDMRVVVFRYFNAAGGYKGIGEHHDPETHLIPLALRGRLTVFGKDYETPDGTPLRDYVHVEDLADAHIMGIPRLDHSGFHDYNLGTGTPYSVLEITKWVEQVTGKRVECTVGGRRNGDPPVLYTSSVKAQQELGWTPRHGIEDIVRSASEMCVT